MGKKPTVFLSHSSKDREFIEKIEQDLRKNRIDAWYAGWEIPPGKSLRKKIFEEGIPNCNAFFVYLSPNSINSKWVKKELDAAFIEQSKEKDTDVLTFISSDDLIAKLPIDITSMNCPTINKENYDKGLSALITAIYEAKISSMLKQHALESENEILKLEKTIADLKTEISKSSKDTSNELKSIEKALEANFFRTKDIRCTALTIFESLWPYFANGAVRYVILKKAQILTTEVFEFSEIISPFIIRNLIIEKTLDDFPSGEPYRCYYLTDLGKEFASYITKEGYTFNKATKKVLITQKTNQ